MANMIPPIQPTPGKPLLLNDAQMDVLIKQGGWRVFQPGYDLSYKSQWNSEWFIVREFIQNALDEHDEAGIQMLPSARDTAEGFQVIDEGRGIGASALLLRETKRAAADLRGQFGEGMKFACLTAVRLGYLPHIISPKTEIIAVGNDTFFDHQEKVQLLVFLWRTPPVDKVVGTTATIHGMKGAAWLNNIVPFKPVTRTHTVSIQLGRFRRPNTIILSEPDNFYYRDIFIRKLQGALFSYNIWWEIQLNPDRNAEANNSKLELTVMSLWSRLTDTGVIREFLSKVVPNKDCWEANAYNAGYTPSTDTTQLAWQKVWNELYPNSCLHTSDKWSLRARGYGFRVMTLSTYFTSFLSTVALTDQSATIQKGGELEKTTIIPDNNLTGAQLSNLKALRWIHSALHLFKLHEDTRVVAATFPDVDVSGLWDGKNRIIYILGKKTGYFYDALETFTHEAGHELCGGCSDLTREHTAAITHVAISLAQLMGSTSNWRQLCISEDGSIIKKWSVEVAKVKVPKAVPVGAAVSGLKEEALATLLDQLGSKYSSKQLKGFAGMHGIDTIGTKSDIIKRLMKTGHTKELYD